MGDISTWNPVDNSNTTAPPDGWPESMAPSAVNNSARAMMGAVRRWYDTVTAQLASLTTADNLRVLKAGDTMTGNLTGTNITAAGQLTGGYVHSTGDVHADNAMGAPTITATTMTATGTIQAAQLTSTSFVSANGYQVRAGTPGPFAGNNFNVEWRSGSQAHLWIDNVDQGTMAFIVGGTLTAPNFVGSVTIPPGGSITLPPGGTLAVTGNINASSDLIAGNNIFADNKIFTQHLEVDQDAFIGVLTIDNGLQVSNGVCYNQSGSWVSLSDVTLKDDIAPYRRGLDAVLALNPVSFRYRPEVFGDDSAKIVHFGLVADEVAPLVPEMVGETMLRDRAVSTLTPGHLAFVLINACKELSVQNAELSAQNAALAARIEALEGTHE